MSKSQFRTLLEGAVSARHSRLNPFTEKWVKGELTRAQLGAWAAQHHQYVSQFPRWCATVYGGAPARELRDVLVMLGRPGAELGTRELTLHPLLRERVQAAVAGADGALE